MSDYEAVEIIGEIVEEYFDTDLSEKRALQRIAGVLDRNKDAHITKRRQRNE